MSISSEPFAILLILIGLLLVVDLLLQAVLRRTPVPAAVIHLALGFALAVAEWRWGWLSGTGRGVINFLGNVGIVFLLFRVGLESNISKLLQNLRGASFAWIADITVSGSLSFLAAG
jgi:Kef-type K+ transport system membrane component KefB